MPRPRDPEVVAISRIQRIMEDLAPDAAQRVARFLIDKFRRDLLDPVGEATPSA